MAGYPDWTRAIRLLGVDSDGNPITILLGSDGRLSALIQGWDGADYRTVRVDSEGRLSAFIIDSTDAWGQILEVGNAELAARLGSLRVYDRRGMSILEHKFDCGLGLFSVSGVGTGHAETLNPVYWRTGGYSVKLVGGSDGDGTAYVTASLPVLPSAAVAAEGLWSIDTVTDFVRMEVDYWDGTSLYSAKVYYDVSNEALKLYDEDGFWIAVGSGIKLNMVAGMFNYWKLVVDAMHGNYSRLLVNGVEYDASTFQLFITAASVAPRVAITFSNYSRAGNNDVVYLDSIAASAVEPA